jgi:hypothetical protein
MLTDNRYTLELRPRFALTDVALAPDQEDYSCVCGTYDNSVGMLDCDDCHKWFHFVCVGLNDKVCVNPNTFSSTSGSHRSYVEVLS